MPTPRPRLVALDIDGTLIAPGSSHLALPDAEIAAAIAALTAAGVQVVLASGRMYPGTLRVARHLQLHSPIISLQGASVHAADGSALHRFTIDPAIALELARFARAEGWPYAVFDTERYVASAPNPASHEFAQVSFITPEYVEAPERVGIEATGVDIISRAGAARVIHEQLSTRYGERVHLLDFPNVTAAHAPDASKGNALALVAAALGIESADVVAIGDSVNDVSMLRWAGRGIALPHCDAYARAVADEVLGGQGVSGVAPCLWALRDAYLN